MKTDPSAVAIYCFDHDYDGLHFNILGKFMILLLAVKVCKKAGFIKYRKNLQGHFSKGSV